MKDGKNKNSPDLERVRELFKELSDILDGVSEVAAVYSYRSLREAIIVLDSDAPDRDKLDFSVTTYRALFRGRGGLSEFYFWDSDGNKRADLNAPLERVRGELKELFKPFV